jgi:hypothetical protein
MGVSRLRKFSIRLNFFRPEQVLRPALMNLSIPLPLRGPEQATSFSEALTGLETLEIACGCKTCHQLFCHLPPLKCLTRLCIYANVFDSDTPTIYTPGHFLTGLSRLHHLVLQNVLDVRRWHADAGMYVARLTALTELGIHISACKLEDVLKDASQPELGSFCCKVRLLMLRADYRGMQKLCRRAGSPSKVGACYKCHVVGLTQQTTGFSKTLYPGIKPHLEHVCISILSTPGGG